jgi:hypothetical protein
MNYRSLKTTTTMKTHLRYSAVAVLLLVTGTVHAQVTETMSRHFVDLDTVVVTPAQKWVVDSICVAMEIKDHSNLLVMYKKMPDRYFASLNKRLMADHEISREELISYESGMIALAEKKFPIYRKAYENTLTANK